MIFEAASTVLMGGISLYAYLKQNGATNDQQRIQKLFTLSGLNVKHGGKTYTAQLVRKKQHDWGVQYVYRIPEGRQFSDYEDKIGILKDGLNNRATKFNLKSILKREKLGGHKEVELSFDGMLHVKVYDQPFPTEIPYLTEDTKGWRVPLGVKRDGKEVYLDFEKTPHVGLGGATRYGKSNLLNSIIVSLLHTQPNNVEFTFIDLKGGVELCDYENLKQTQSIAYEPEEALKALEAAYNGMRKIQNKLKGKAKKVQDAGLLKRHFIIIDEVGELNPAEATNKVDKKLKEECQRYMSQIARLGAGLGYRLIVATQYPTGDVIPRAVKQNCDVKICFRVRNSTASQVVLDEGGAEKLPAVKGRAIVQLADKQELLQTFFINTEVISQVSSPYITNISKRVVLADEKESIDSETGANTFVLEETRFSD